MNNARKTLAIIRVPIAVGLLSLICASGSVSRQADADQPAGDISAQAHLEQAANSIVAAARQSVRATTSDEEAVTRTHLSIEALRVIGLLGDFDTDSQTAELLDDLQAGARPAVAEAIIQLRLARQLRRWSDLDALQRKAAIDRFVADVKKDGLTAPHADLVIRFTDNLERANNNELAADAINALLPSFRASDDPAIQRRTTLLEGIARRLNLVGEPLELDGTLLDGSQFDWDSYRGKVVLVDFFANWCEVCRAEVPSVLENYRVYRDKEFDVVGVSLDKQRRLAEMYRQQTGFQFPTLFSDDPKAAGWDNPIGRKYGVTALPRAILVDKSGIVVDTVARGQRLERQLQDLLGEPAVPRDRQVGESHEDTAESDVESDDVVPAGFEEQPTTQPELDNSK